MKHRGVHYDTGRAFRGPGFGIPTRRKPLDMAVVQREVQIVRDDLHATSHNGYRGVAKFTPSRALVPFASSPCAPCRSAPQFNTKNATFSVDVGALLITILNDPEAGTAYFT